MLYLKTGYIIRQNCIENDKRKFSSAVIIKTTTEEQR